MLDEYMSGVAERISPEAPVPVVSLVEHVRKPGGAANAALSIVSLGGSALVVGVAGEDENGKVLRTLLADTSIGDLLVSDPDRPTTTKLRIVASGQQIARLDIEDAAPVNSSVEASVVDRALAQLEDVDAVLVSDYSKGVVSPEVAQRVIAAARARNIPTIVDPKDARVDRYRGATVITPNLAEATRAAHFLGCDATAIEELGAVLTQRLDPTALLITRGADGATLFQLGSGPTHILALERRVFDVTGAGDTVAATIALALATGCDLPLAAQVGVLAAGVAVGKPGTGTVTSDELLAEA